MILKGCLQKGRGSFSLLYASCFWLVAPIFCILHINATAHFFCFFFVSSLFIIVIFMSRDPRRWPSHASFFDSMTYKIAPWRLDPLGTFGGLFIKNLGRDPVLMGINLEFCKPRWSAMASYNFGDRVQITPSLPYPYFRDPIEYSKSHL